MTTLPGAVCADGHDYWHADDVRERADAVSLCLACPARDACTLDREAALDNGVRLFGVWAGVDYGMAKGYARVHVRDVMPCGTSAAARRHRRRGEPVCPACATAERVRRADYARTVAS